MRRNLKNVIMRHQHLPADAYSTMVIPSNRHWNPNAIHIATTAPLEDWSSGLPPIVERTITPRTAVQTTPTAGSDPAQSPGTPAYVDLTADNSDKGTAPTRDEQHGSARKQDKAKRKHVATGKPRGRPPKDSKPDGDPDKVRERRLSTTDVVSPKFGIMVDVLCVVIVEVSLGV